MKHEQLQDVFYNWPTDPKPPIDSFPIYAQCIIPAPGASSTQANEYIRENAYVSGREIQVALAGFTEGDLKVWSNNHVLHIEGNNLENKEISSKFKCKFHYQIPCIDELYIDEATIFFNNGLLRIQILITESTLSKTYLLGKE